MARTLDQYYKQCRPIRGGKLDLVEVNWMAAMAGTSWQEARDFVLARKR